MQSHSKKWIIESLDNQSKNSKNLLEFMYNIYMDLNKHVEFREKKTDLQSNQMYKQEVLNLLESEKSLFPLSDDHLRNMQINIENLTMKFDEKSIYKQASNLIRILIKKDGQSAKDYLLEKDTLSPDEKTMLLEFGQYTIEALIIYVLGIMFNTSESETMVRASSLIDQLDLSVRTHSKLLKSHLKQNVNMSEKKDHLYSIGVHLLEFMHERKLVSSITKVQSSRVVKKTSKGSYYSPSNVFIVCQFDISLLPIKLNLPMIYPPLDWKSASPNYPRYLSDLSGGYLSGPSGEIYDRYRLLSSENLNHFFLYIGNSDSGLLKNIKHDYMSLCNVMNGLQRQPFTINSDWLNYLTEFEGGFVDEGLLMPKFLASLNIKDVYPILRESHMKDELINKEFSFNTLLNTVQKAIQRSRYEQLLLNLARAYDGYKFYLPAFLDFRGRIYRSGILHFHDRDLARSLIVFADDPIKGRIHPNEPNLKANIYSVCLASSFHFQSFKSMNEANDFLHNNILNKSNMDNLLSYAAAKAKRPFQFLANINAIHDGKSHYIPITQDAASSAYQIMSYFLLDETMAERTNLFKSPDNEIKDVYLFFLEELKEFMKGELENNLCSVVSKHLTRKIVKSIFMPIIYGKTLMSTATDLMDSFSQHLTRQECFRVASVCFQFFKEKYNGMECLIRLIRLIGWVASARESAVLYNVNYFTTIQDYMKMMAINIWVYDRTHKKRRRVTLRVSSDNRDRRKTEISTFVNFIHQKDAFIAMNVVAKMLEFNLPIYTVHDNFITTAKYSHLIPIVYLQVFRSLGPPLSIINKFIHMNLQFPCSKSFENNVISKKYLSSILKCNIPSNISKQNHLIWEKKISEIETCYSEYLKQVCGVGNSSYNNSWKSHEEKWKKFSDKLTIDKVDILTSSFCVHY